MKRDFSFYTFIYIWKNVYKTEPGDLEVAVHKTFLGLKKYLKPKDT